MDRPHILGLTREQLAVVLERQGEPGYRADQLFSWVHARDVLDPAEMTDLPLGLRGELARMFRLQPPRILDSLDAGDGTSKMVLGLHDGLRIESVLIPREEDGESVTTTLCVSSQVGCRVGCRFCRSGQQGLVRNLMPWEIVAQVAAARRLARVDRVVFMGIGEPLDSYEAVADSIRILSDPRGMALAPRRFVVSTVGRIAGIRRLGEDFQGRVGLALSLHSLSPSTRDRLLGSRAPDPERVLEAAREYPLGPRDRITVEVVLAAGVNDSTAEASRLARGLAGLRCRVNLIPLNPGGTGQWRAPEERDVDSYRSRIAKHGFPVFVRQRRGDAILAACGQLAFSRE